MPKYKAEEAEIMLMSLAKILVMEHDPTEVATAVKEDEKTFAVAGAAALIAWISDFIIALTLDAPEEEVVND